MLPRGIILGHGADRWSREPIFAAVFLILSIRSRLYTRGNHPAWLVGVQILAGAGIYGALVPFIIADLTRCMGRPNLAHGSVATIMAPARR